MPLPLLGLHHVTAICSDPQRNVDFYAGALGLRLVKQTVNYDDPTTWHLYYGDAAGTPGTIITFFAWPDADGGQIGIGQFGTVSFAIPTSAFGYWVERLISLGISYQHPARRFGERYLAFRDPDGLNLELVAVADPPASEPWEQGSVPPQHAIRGIHGVTLWTGSGDTADFFTELLGFTSLGGESTTQRLAVGRGPASATLDLVGATGLWNGSVSVGTIHHVAWQVATGEDERDWQAHLRAQDIAASEVRDRSYFHSIYFDAPGGALQEIATNGPGFAIDEAPATLGTTLQLPEGLEPMRLGLEGSLTPLRIPNTPPAQSPESDS